MALEELVLDLVKKKIDTKESLEKLKKTFAKREGRSLPKNWQLLKAYQRLLARAKVKRSKSIEKVLLAKPIRTLSGVAPLTVLTKPFSCPGRCLYCPDQGGVPKSYLADEPAVLRARQFNFDPAKQVKYRLDVFELMGHQVTKVELIILGGTFSFYPKKYRRDFVKSCFEAANQQKSATLIQAQRTNELASRRIVGVTVETRPDLVTKEEIRFLRRLGVTRVELGVQSLDREILRRVKRGHSLEEVIKATRLLKDAGFKVCHHLMPGLPGSSWEKDLAVFKKLFQDQAFKPDFLKIYPCVVLKEAPLYSVWQKGEFKPLRDEELVKLLVEIKKKIPEYVRINRLGRDIPVGNVVAGYRYSHIRQLVQEKLQSLGLTCRCIRCREIREKEIKVGNLKLKILPYAASFGQEYFLQFVDDQNRLYALLRLRLPGRSETPRPKRPGSLRCVAALHSTSSGATPPVGGLQPCSQPIFPVLKGAALVRELHTFGRSLAIGQKEKKVSQHHGLGQKLLQKAEEISLKNGFSKIAVISGVGVRDYYRQLGYRFHETYLVKSLKR